MIYDQAWQSKCVDGDIRFARKWCIGPFEEIKKWHGLQK